MRKIIVSNKTYTYFVGRSNIVIYTDNFKRVISFQELFPKEDIERAMWKKYFHVKPVHIKMFIKKFIEKELICKKIL